MKLSKLRFAMLGFVFASHMFATPACVTDTLANYVLLGGGGCLVNNVELVDNFAFSVGLNNIGSPLTSSNIMVTPSATANTYTLFFFAPSMGFSVTGTQFVNYNINFTWDPVVVGAEDQMFASTPVFPGTATVVTSLCAGSTFGLGCPPATNTLKVFSDGNPADAIPTDITTFPAVTVVGTQSVVSLFANGASSEITGFTNSVFTPEPGALVFAATGLLALWLRRLRSGRKPSF
jgi:hypothetical protein